VTVLDETADIFKLQAKGLIKSEVILLETYAGEMWLLGRDWKLMNKRKLLSGLFQYVFYLLCNLEQVLYFPLKHPQLLLLLFILAEKGFSFTSAHHLSVHVFGQTIHWLRQTFNVLYCAVLTYILSLVKWKVIVLLKKKQLQLSAVTKSRVMKQLVYVFLQILSPQLLKQLRLEVEFGQKIFLWQSRQHVATVVLNQLVMQKLEVVESATDCSVIRCTVLLLGPDLV